MNVHWISAHPEARSLNGYLAAEGQRALRADGHRVEVSDLYAMGFDPIVDRTSYAVDDATRFRVAAAANKAYEDAALPSDIRDEQRKLVEADTIVLQFPLWWFGMPAMLKGWFDRVWHQGFAYGVPGPDGEWIGYGDGFLRGKRALVVVTMGGPAPFYGERGIHGHIDDLLFPLQHGILFYAGADVLSPVMRTGVDRYTPEDAEQAAGELRARLADIPTDTPIAYRKLTSGDYGDDLVLRPEIAPGLVGLAAHRS
jgi:NAD(P)H dehydrogenase (quinone)